MGEIEAADDGAEGGVDGDVGEEFAEDAGVGDGDLGVEGTEGGGVDRAGS